MNVLICKYCNWLVHSFGIWLTLNNTLKKDMLCEHMRREWNGIDYFNEYEKVTGKIFEDRHLLLKQNTTLL